ncbi:winged helix-turn-helix domain-containing protein [Roseovarius dicentrarchi]|uniref:winged helix-turn-helix domain-containing protein n=1 Tax=Roseovarius dicentrarchi TaxID=2250573 RepID=UPI001EF09127|nr:crosslink repair DNA glycosylase YcaQ family protein [Roseovarius dicentrarchi]
MTSLLDNRTARHLWLHVNGLCQMGTGAPDVMDLIGQIGFLQIDTIRNVTRAHNHILWSRNSNYREGMLWPLLGQHLFEHFTHDASLIPMQILPLWQRQFARLGAHAARGEWYQSGLGRSEIAAIRARIAAEGPLSTHAFDTKAASREMWARPPHKKALDQMWYAGDLATCRRENFVKFYDLGERVFPKVPQDQDDTAQADALCDLALDRLGTASCGEVQRFWAAMDAHETRDWMARRAPRQVRVTDADGAVRTVLAAPDLDARLAALPPLGNRMRILNPFDPAIRDRARLRRLFGFDYVNEMFVPAARRRWGYYVYPLLEADRFVGRIELKADRAQGRLRVTGFWPEQGIHWGAGRSGRLNAELRRFGRMVGVHSIDWSAPITFNRGS